MTDINKKLITAIYRGNQRKVESMLKKGADPNMYDENGTTPLMLAILSEKADFQIVKTIVESGADVNLQEPTQKWTALHLASRDGNYEIADLLIRHGAIVDVRDCYGNTALGRAVFKGDTNLIRLLVDNGADINMPNREGISPMKLAETIGNETLLKALKT